jgi:hypothetical protein
MVRRISDDQGVFAEFAGQYFSAEPPAKTAWRPAARVRPFRQGRLMEMHAALLQPLLTGLPADDRQWIVERIANARDHQLELKRNPPRRRRRNGDGQLVPPPPDL